LTADKQGDSENDKSSLTGPFILSTRHSPERRSPLMRKYLTTINSSTKKPLLPTLEGHLSKSTATA